MSERRAKLAAWASLYSGVMFGIFWIPLRRYDEVGFSGVWSTLMLSAMPLAFLIPVMLWRRRTLLPGRLRMHVAGAMLGLAFVLYANALVYAEVIRVLVLFYLMPAWGFLFARIVLGERITGLRVAAIVLALAGLAVMFGVHGGGLPLPRNAGEWMAFCSGITWALGSLMLLTDAKAQALDYGCLFFLYASVVAGLFCVVGGSPAPFDAPLRDVLVWSVPVTLLIVIPAGFAAMFGPMVLNPGVVGLLFMTEITVGTITAALWAGEPFGAPELIGVVLISTAGLIEPLTGLRKAAVPAA